MIDKLIERSRRPATSRSSTNHVLDEVLGDERGVTGVRLVSTTKNGTQRKIECKASSSRSATRRTRESSQGQLEMEGGYIVTRTGPARLCDGHERRRRVRGRRRRRPDLSSSRHVGRLGLHGRARRRTLSDRRLECVHNENGCRALRPLRVCDHVSAIRGGLDANRTTAFLGGISRRGGRRARPCPALLARQRRSRTACRSITFIRPRSSPSPTARTAR